MCARAGVCVCVCVRVRACVSLCVCVCELKGELWNSCRVPCAKIRAESSSWGEGGGGCPTEELGQCRSQSKYYNAIPKGC